MEGRKVLVLSGLERGFCGEVFFGKAWGTGQVKVYGSRVTHSRTPDWPRKRPAAAGTPWGVGAQGLASFLEGGRTYKPTRERGRNQLF